MARSRFLRLSGAAFVAALFAACGGDSGGQATTSVDVSFMVFKGGADVACASVSEISEVEIRVIAPSGALRAGFPRAIDCAAAHEAINLPAGEHIVEISARGELAGDMRAVLFRSTSTITTPETSTLQVSLRPEVAFLTINWSFGSSALLPCDTEVGEVDVLVSTGTAQGTAFHQRFACMDTPVVVPAPLPLASYTILIDAYSSQEFILFSGTAVRSLERGDNDVTVMLAAMGGRLYMDWIFAIRGQPIRPCDDDRVMVTGVEASVSSTEGGNIVATESFACGVPRPHGFVGQRYRPGRMLEMVLVAEGVQRFRGVERFMMPAGDRYQDPPLVLEAVGTASVSVSVRTSTCAELLSDAFSIEIFDVDGGGVEPVAEVNLNLGMHDVAIPDLPFGDYWVDVALMRGRDRLCTVRERRSIDDRLAVWEPFIL